tara:strand:+ start:333 stop:479 length:147 start_codon:yes stop_codon:yes gene_type:complete
MFNLGFALVATVLLAAVLRTRYKRSKTTFIPLTDEQKDLYTPQERKSS